VSEQIAVTRPPLKARSPFEFRVNLGREVAESEVRGALASGEMGFLHSFTAGSATDGPGLRVVAWTSGCTWRCLYCHNPDTWTMSNGIPVTVARVTEELRKYRYALELMKGGLTISGGEPLMQHRFVLKLFAAAKAMGVHTALETNGHGGDRLTDQELSAIDLVMLGIKTWDPERHLLLTEMDNAPTLRLARRLAAQGRKMWIRFVLVPGITDEPEDVANIARFAAGLGNVERVEVLPFHQMGSFKWQRLGLQYTLAKVQPPPPELAQQICEIFRGEGLTVY